MWFVPFQAAVAVTWTTRLRQSAIELASPERATGWGEAERLEARRINLAMSGLTDKAGTLRTWHLTSSSKSFVSAPFLLLRRTQSVRDSLGLNELPWFTTLAPDSVHSLALALTRSSPTTSRPRLRRLHSLQALSLKNAPHSVS